MASKPAPGHVANPTPVDPADAAKTPANVEPERQHFRALLLANPNYFGNLENSTFQPVKPLKGNTSYEQLVCLGLDSPFDRLEAVLEVKRPFGYGGTICTNGTREYVRFYVDRFGNGVWHDVGIGSVVVHDIPGPKPLCYAVKLDFDPFMRFCTTENIVKVRAILSWNAPPPPNSPNFVPVWGNALTVEVQIRPRRKLIVQDLLDVVVQQKVKIPDPIGPVVHLLDPAATVPVKPMPPLNLAAKRSLYASGAQVPVHRYAFAEAQAALSAPAGAQTFDSGGQSPLLNLGLSAAEVADIVKSQFPVNGDTGFEELRCVGLLPEEDLLEAVFTIKRPSGYSGGLCTSGSREYVAFWIDFADGVGFTYVGTTSIRVHDLRQIPPAGVQYAVFKKADLAKRLVACEQGPRVVQVRAILSWEAPPPPANPNYVPVWGNRQECLIQLRPGLPGQTTTHTPVIETVANVNVGDIGIGGLRTSGQNPFGGAIRITGRLGDPPDSFNGTAPRLKYKIEVSRDNITWLPLGNPITVRVSQALFGTPQDCDPSAPFDVICPVTLTPTDDGDGQGFGWYEYLEDYKGPYTQSLVQDELGLWLTDASMEGLWHMRITAKDPSTSTVYAGFATVDIFVDNTAPTATLAVTGATLNGNPVPAVACGKFKVGTIITGTYKVQDLPTVPSGADHFGSLTLEVIPAAQAAGANLTLALPSSTTGTTASRSFPAVPTTGESGTWTLDTTGMQPCGYVLRLRACDRTIYYGTEGILCSPYADHGFCLE
jgi:hypothetical protein